MRKLYIPTLCKQSKSSLETGLILELNTYPNPMEVTEWDHHATYEAAEYKNRASINSLSCSSKASSKRVNLNSVNCPHKTNYKQNGDKKHELKSSKSKSLALHLDVSYAFFNYRVFNVVLFISYYLQFCVENHYIVASKI